MAMGGQGAQIWAAVLVGLVAFSGCMGASASEPIIETITPTPVIYTEDPFSTVEATVGPTTCEASMASKKTGFVPTLTTSTWPGPMEHMAVFRMTLEESLVPAGSDSLTIEEAGGCIGWRFRMHTHLQDGNGTTEWYLQANGTGLALGLILPIVENGTYHWDLHVTVGGDTLVSEGSYPDHRTRQLFGFCDPHQAACVKPAAQDSVSLDGRFTAGCKPEPGSVSSNSQSMGGGTDLLGPCEAAHTFTLQHAFHSWIRVRMEYVYDVADLDYELMSPTGERAGLRATIGDPTRSTGNRTEEDLVVVDPKLLSQVGEWEIHVWAKYAVDAEYRFLVEFGI